MNISSPLVNDVRFILLRDEAVVISVSKKSVKFRSRIFIRNESVPKIIVNDAIKFFVLNCNQNFANFKP